MSSELRAIITGSIKWITFRIIKSCHCEPEGHGNLRSSLALLGTRLRRPAPVGLLTMTY